MTVNSHQNTEKQRNTILITIDCWRGDHLGLYNQGSVKTPNIDKLASEGTYFSNTYTCGGWTKIAMTSLFSSTRSSQYNLSTGPIEDARPLLAKSLQKAGYETAGMTTNLVCGTPHGFDKGFDFFEDVRPQIKKKFHDYFLAIRGMTRLSKKKFFRKFMASIGLAFEPAYPTMDANELVDRAIEWLNQSHDRPYFLWLHFMDLHWPYKSSLRHKDFNEKDEMWVDRVQWIKVRNSKGVYRPGMNREERWHKLYREETEMLDTALGRLFDVLRQREDWENCDIIITGDHGEEFYEHGTWGHSWNQLHQEGSHVPLIIRFAGHNKQERIDTPISHIDIAPTILERSRTDIPDTMIGKSLYSQLSKQRFSNDPVLTEMHGHANSIGYRLSIVHNGYRYIYDGDRDACHLFALESDPNTIHNIYNKDDPVSRKFDALRLKHITTGILSRLKSGMPVVGEDMIYDIDADPKVVERLRALGYLD